METCSTLHPALTEAVALLSGSTGDAPVLDYAWFSRLRLWMEQLTEHPPIAQRLRHPLMLFALDAMDEGDRPYNQDGLACLVAYLHALRHVTAQDLRTAVWLHDDLEIAYNSRPVPELNDEETTDSLLVQDASTTAQEYLVFDVVHAIIKTLNAKVQPGTPYMHCAPLMVTLLTTPGWSPCQLIAHFRASRGCQFELLNRNCMDLPGENQTLHGMLALYTFSYMHSTAWTPPVDEHLAVLDTVVWDVLCLTSLGSQGADWLDTLVNYLPNAGLAVLHGLGMTASFQSGQYVPVFTPAFPSLRVYAETAWSDAGKAYNRAQWFERRHPRLAQAMATLLSVLPAGPKAFSDWTALNQWWQLEVQGLTPHSDAVGTLALPAGFDEA